MARMEDILKTPRLIDWLKTQPAKDRYYYSNGLDCVLAQYFKASGLRNVAVGMFDFAYDRKSEMLPAGWDDIAKGSERMDRTFGDALRRAQAVAQMEVAHA